MRSRCKRVTPCFYPFIGLNGSIGKIEAYSAIINFYIFLLKNKGG